MLATKTSVVPLTNQTTPRLELLGTLILSRLVKTVTRVLQQFTAFKSEAYITESQMAQVVLTWIKTIDKNTSNSSKTE